MEEDEFINGRVSLNARGVCRIVMVARDNGCVLPSIVRGSLPLKTSWWELQLVRVLWASWAIGLIEQGSYVFTTEPSTSGPCQATYFHPRVSSAALFSYQSGLSIREKDVPKLHLMAAQCTQF